MMEKVDGSLLHDESHQTNKAENLKPYTNTRHTCCVLLAITLGSCVGWVRQGETMKSSCHCVETEGAQIVREDGAGCSNTPSKWAVHSCSVQSCERTIAWIFLLQ
jgi:hypothetical protein